MVRMIHLVKNAPPEGLSTLTQPDHLRLSEFLLLWECRTTLSTEIVQKDPQPKNDLSPFFPLAFIVK